MVAYGARHWTSRDYQRYVPLLPSHQETSMSHILYRENLDRDLPIAVAGDDCYLIDAAGKRYLDASGGAAVSCLGHSNEAVRKAIHDQVDRLAFAHTRFFTTAAAEQRADYLETCLAGRLCKLSCTVDSKGAVQAALKIMPQSFVER